MDFKDMIGAINKPDKNAKTYELSTDYKYTGLKEYPRPQLQRESYINLNGQWNYRIIDGRGAISVNGEITVPFSPECRLSGVDRHTLQPEETLEYWRTFVIDKVKKSKRLILNFGAVDQVAHISVNGSKVGSHEGGYTSFSFDITDYLVEGENTLRVQVRDYTDAVGYARGKQSLEPGGMWYRAQSGIWQTVWMEWVPKAYVKSMRIVPDIDKKTLSIGLKVSDIKGQIDITSVDTGLIKSYEVTSIKDGVVNILIKLGKFKLWTPDEPNLYFITITYGKDVFSTYFAMRAFTTEVDEAGFPRLCINHKPVFMNGVLDQGYYPESLMTPPSEEAMIADIELIKKLGFNMMRKHCKVEPMRYYYHCDRLGIVVWQDIVNGGTKYDMNMICNVPTVVRPFGNAHDKNRIFLRFTGRRDPKTKDLWRLEASEIVNQLASLPCIGLWTVFNEGWGQFEAKKCVEFLRQLDNTRPFDSASGWFHEDCGDVLSDHIYFEEFKVKNSKMPYVISEYGGYSLKVGNHVSRDAIYGYRKFNEPTELQAEYDKTMEKIQALIPLGLSGAVYTQTTDIEDEQNGLITYDRQVQKIYKLN